MNIKNIQSLSRQLRRFRPEKGQEKDIRLMIRLADSVEADIKKTVRDINQLRDEVESYATN